MNSIQKIESAVYAIRPELKDKPITLSDILLVFWEKCAMMWDWQFLLDNGESLECHPYDDFWEAEYYPKYNLRLSPYDQSEDTINFIAENLTK